MAKFQSNLWRGQWTPQQYRICDQVLDDGWLAIANKTTEDRPAPQPQGNPVWLSGLGDTPAWSTPSDTATSVMTGQRVTMDTTRIFTAWRVWFPVADSTVEYSLLFIRDPLGAEIVNVEFSGFVASETGWRTVTIQPFFVSNGEVFDVLLITHALTTPTQWGSTWDYKRKNDSGISDGEIWHHSNGSTMRIAHLDDGDTDRSTDLEALNPGDSVSAGGTEWDILSTTHNADHVVLSVSPTTRLQENTYTFTFTTYTTAPITYVRIANHYLSNPNVKGFFDNGYDPEQLTLDDDAYGVDVQIQDMVASPDWELQAFTG